MTDRPHYAQGRASAPNASHSGRTDYDLIARLREIRKIGEEAMWAVEEYDPTVGIELSSCADEAAVQRILDAWLARRVSVLKRTQSELREAWRVAHAERNAVSQPPLSND